MGVVGGYITDRYGAKWFILAGSGLLLAGLLTLSLTVQSQTSEFDLVWRLLLIGCGIGLFTAPNQTLLMSVGAHETMGAAGALSNLGARLGSIFGPLTLAVTWAVLPTSLSAQMGIAILILVSLAVLNLLFAWLLLQWKSRTSPLGTRSPI